MFAVLAQLLHARPTGPLGWLLVVCLLSGTAIAQPATQEPTPPVDAGAATDSSPNASAPGSEEELPAEDSPAKDSPETELDRPDTPGVPTPEDGTPEFTSAVMGFVFAHCAPWPDVVRASFDDQRFREEALIFCGGLTPTDFQTAFQRLEEQSKQLEAAQVEPMSGLGEKKPSPATSPAS